MLDEDIRPGPIPGDIDAPADEDDAPKEECGVFGIYAPGEDVARLTYFGLFALQHRGQESAGIMVSDGSEIKWYKEMGLVTQVFDERTLSQLKGHLGIGHTRYSTTGSSVLRNAQPLHCAWGDGTVAVAHNGNLVNTEELRAELEADGVPFETTNRGRPHDDPPARGVLGRDFDGRSADRHSGPLRCPPPLPRPFGQQALCAGVGNMRSGDHRRSLCPRGRAGRDGRDR